MKINELLTNDNKLIEKIEELIYFDEIWKFPEYNLKEYLNIIDSEYLNMIDISTKIVSQMNNQKLDPNNYNKEIFYKVIKSTNHL
jgi:Ni,Fe-hydrogenase I large subunit